jgi:transposase
MATIRLVPKIEQLKKGEVTEEKKGDVRNKKKSALKDKIEFYLAQEKHQAVKTIMSILERDFDLTNAGAVSAIVKSGIFGEENNAKKYMFFRWQISKSKSPKTLQEVAAILNVTIPTLYAWKSSGDMLDASRYTVQNTLFEVIPTIVRMLSINAISDPKFTAMFLEMCENMGIYKPAKSEDSVFGAMLTRAKKEDTNPIADAELEAVQ